MIIAGLWFFCLKLLNHKKSFADFKACKNAKKKYVSYVAKHG
jgi:hypothetical protein